MKAYIFIGGELSLTANDVQIGEDDLLIAADSGYDNAKAIGLAERVDMIVGDFDSTSERSFPSRARIVRVPAEKDDSDTQLAVSMALESGAESIALVGGLSGRLDHTLANLLLLVSIYKQSGIHATITDGTNRVQYVERSSVLIPRSRYQYLSLIPVGETAGGVTANGVKYPLVRATLKRSTPSFAISNEIVGSCAMVSCARGGIFVIES